jgi:hypothetical protein
MAKLFSAVHTHLDPFGVRETPEGAVSEGFTAGDYVLLRVTAYSLVLSLICFCNALYISISVVTAPS